MRPPSDESSLPPGGDSNQLAGDHPAKPPHDTLAAHYNVMIGDHAQGVVIGEHIVVEQHFHALIDTPAQSTPPDELPAPGEPPYMGLRYFDTGDAALFYGRESLSRELAARLVDERFLAIVGASGSGKSSLARAGVVPLWKAGIPAPTRTDIAGRPLCGPVHIITPTAHPLESLAASLTQHIESVTAMTTLIGDMRMDTRSLQLYTRKLAGGTDTGLLLVIDQFEEAFTLCKDPVERQVFVDNLLAATAEESGSLLRVVVTLRADFYHCCAEVPGLPQVLQAHQAYIVAMGRDQLRQAIEAPALQAGPETGGPWEFEPGLIDLILQDVGDEPGTLPLLSHALLETWQRRQGHRMTLAGYRAAGEVRKAIALTAEDVYNRLTPEAQSIARGIFLRLTELGEGVQDTRRRTRLDELATSPEQQIKVQVVLQILANARLVTVDKEEAQVAHEALIREWPTLKRWLDEDREDLHLHRKLTESAVEWDTEVGGRGDGGSPDSDLLYRGARLAQACELAERHLDWLNALEHRFLDASLTAQQKVEAQAEAQRQHELAQAQRLAQTQRQRSLVLGVGLAIAMLLMSLAGWLYSQSQSNLSNARARGTLAAANAATATNALGLSQIRGTQVVANAATATYALGMSLASGTQAAAEKQRAKEQALIALARQLSAQARSELEKPSPDQARAGLLAVQSLRLLPSIDAQQVLQKNTLASETARMSHDGSVTSLAFSPDGRYVASGGQDNMARVWEAASGKEIALMPHADLVRAVAFSPDSRYVATSSKDGTARVWSISTAGRDKEKAVNSGNEIAHVTHNGPVSGVAFSPDGRLVVSAGGNAALVWEAVSGKLIAHMTHSDHVIAAAFSPDGRYVGSGGTDNMARVWEAATGVEISSMTHTEPITSLAFSPDGRYVVSASGDRVTGNNSIKVWEVASGNEIARMTHEHVVNAVSFSPNARYVLSGSADGTARVWSISSGSSSNEIGSARGKEIARMNHDGNVKVVAFSPDSNSVVSGSIDGTARVWAVASGKEIARATHDEAVTAVVFSPDGRTVVSASDDGAIQVWESNSWREFARMTHGEVVTSAVFSQDGRYIVTGGLDHTARVWSVGIASSDNETILQSGKEIARMTHEGSVNAVAFSLDCRYVVSGSADGTARVWEAATGNEIARVNHNAPVYAVAFSPDGRFVVSAGGNKPTTGYFAKVWEAISGNEIASMAHGGSVYTVAFSPDSRRVVSGSADGTARLWTFTTESSAGIGKEIVRVTHANPVREVAFSPDGTWVISGDEAGTAVVWAAANGKEITRMYQSGSVDAVSFSPDSRLMALGSKGGTILVWDIASDEKIARMDHDDRVWSVAFSPDSRYVLSASRDGTARVWNVSSEVAADNGEEITRLTHDGNVWSAAFSPNGRYVVSASSDGTARVWLWRPDDLLAYTCQFLPRNLTYFEWQSYIGDMLPYEPVCPNLGLEPPPLWTQAP